MEDTRIEISVRGKWRTVKALHIDGKNLIVKGKWIRQAVVDAEEWLETEVENPELYVGMLKEHRSREMCPDIFTFTQKLPAIVPKYRYPMEWDSVAAMPITTFNDWWEKLPQTTRKNVRRSEKRGVTVTVETLNDRLIHGLVALNNDSAVRQGRPYTHYGKTFDQVKKDQSSFLDRSDLICAYAGEELIGFLKMVYRGDIASLLQVLPKESHQDKRPANALLAKAIERCVDRRVTYLTYGMFNYGNKRDSSLREFKIRNGFEEVLVPRYYVPLTAKGMLWMRLNLHRGLIGVLPHWVIASGVSMRSKWYHWAQAMSRCSSTAEQLNRNRQMECSNPPAGSNN